jgi:hypothetical protein
MEWLGFTRSATMARTKSMMYAQEKTIQVHIGMFARQHLRQMLEEQRFGGSHIRWIEERNGWFQKTIFRIRGPEREVIDLGERIQYWMMCSGETR